MGYFKNHLRGGESFDRKGRDNDINSQSHGNSIADVQTKCDNHRCYKLSNIAPLGMVIQGHPVAQDPPDIVFFKSLKPSAEGQETPQVSNLIQ